MRRNNKNMQIIPVPRSGQRHGTCFCVNKKKNEVKKGQNKICLHLPQKLNQKCKKKNNKIIGTFSRKLLCIICALKILNRLFWSVWVLRNRISWSETTVNFWKVLDKWKERREKKWYLVINNINVFIFWPNLGVINNDEFFFYSICFVFAQVGATHTHTPTHPVPQC